ncbi:MAG: M13 family metallopeptidase [Verrucomicrobia bacterium]|nr:M13 family metallopeptidase [Verrucomicrobiota bacterium]
MPPFKMKLNYFRYFVSCWVVLVSLAALAAEPTRPVPRFSTAHMDRGVDPSVDFYRYAAGIWLKNNPVPADKARWGGFDELQERNWQLIHEILNASAAESTGPANLPRREVGDFFASAGDTNRIEKFAFKPIERDLRRIDQLKNTAALFALIADFHERGIGGFFTDDVSPDEKSSDIYAFHLAQGGLGLPDRDYYLKKDFAKQREDYRQHISRMFTLLGEMTMAAEQHAALVIDIETTLAKSSRTRVELRDPNANYHKFKVADFATANSASAWPRYFVASGLDKVPEVIVGQPEFFAALDQLVKERPLADWKVYLRWHLLRGAASYLHRAVEAENFAFYGTKLRGQPEPEPRWQRAARVIDSHIGEALGQLYVEKYFPASARTRMNELIGNLREVFRDRLKKLAWMSESTRAKALVKFDRFTQKIGHPEKFRDYSPVKLRRDDYLGNVQRAAVFETRRQIARVGRPVDKTEWHMTPQTVNAYFNPLQNEIVFPAGILQPPFFDVEADDAVNYGAIGVVIGHEITHGYDDEGRKYDASGNLSDWWTEMDAKEFDARAQKVVDQYAGYEALPGLKVNGKLTLGENIADLGGTSIAYEALQRALAKDPSKRKPIDGFTPEQRFFLSLAQLWRTNWREAELRRRITVDPHSPGQFRAIGPHVNLPEFYEAFQIKEGAPMWRAPELRAKIW